MHIALTASRLHNAPAYKDRNQISRASSHRHQYTLQTLYSTQSLASLYTRLHIYICRPPCSKIVIARRRRRRNKVADCRRIRTDAARIYVWLYKFHKAQLFFSSAFPFPERVYYNALHCRARMQPRERFVFIVRASFPARVVLAWKCVCRYIVSRR